MLGSTEHTSDIRKTASTVQRLNVALTQRQYGQAANHLSALLSLSKEFEGYDDIQRIHEIRTHVRELEANAFTQAKNEFAKYHVASLHTALY